MPSPTGKKEKEFPFFRVDRDVKMWYTKLRMQHYHKEVSLCVKASLPLKLQKNTV